MKKKVAFLNAQDPHDPLGFSGTTKEIITQLERFYDVDWVNPTTKLSRYLSRLLHKQQIGRFQISTAPLFVRKMVARNFKRIVKNKDYDYIFNISMNWPFIDYDMDIPVITFMDATTPLMIGNYYNIDNLSSKIVKMTLDQEKNLIDISDIILLPTQWAYDSVIDDYQGDPNNVHIIKLGVNLNLKPNHRMLDDNQEVIKLLFVGVDKQAKGYDIVIDTMKQLNKIDTKHTYHLDIVGLNNLTKVDKVIFHGFLNKSNPEEAKKLEQLYQQADLFFVPSRFESFGYVFLEASGNGLPVITSAVGGIPESIIHNETGLVLPYEAKGLDYAQKIIDLVKNPQLYSQFSINGINRIQDNYSWQLWGDTVYSILENFMR